MRSKSLGGEEMRQQFFRDKLSPYTTLIELMVLEGNQTSALETSELTKARVLLDLISGGRRRVQKYMTEAELQEEARLVNAAVKAEQERERAAADAKTPPDKLAGLEKTAREAKRAHEAFRSRLYIEHPEIQVNRGEMKPASLADAAGLVSRSTAVLEYALSDGKAFLFVVTSDTGGKPSVEAFPLKTSPKELANKIADYRSAVASGSLGFSNTSRELYDLVIKPAASRLAGKTSIIVVPDGPLWDLPFQTLQNTAGKYLVESASISYAPSLTALREMQKRSRDRGLAGDSELLAFGNPFVRLETKERVQKVFMSEKLEPLPEAERLVAGLARMYGPSRSKVFTGADAREETAKFEAPKYRIVQFATHGILNNVSPMYSHLVMAQDQKDPNEDGLLEAWEMKELDLKADMVILSACDTARGKISGGEGVIGMTWAMFIAGAPTTVASQWPVESSSTTELMLEFHRQLLSAKNISKAEALRRAELKLLRDPRYRHPSYWGGWVMVGSGN
jgi:CHAT domain-containing protein